MAVDNLSWLLLRLRMGLAALLVWLALRLRLALLLRRLLRVALRPLVRPCRGSGLPAITWRLYSSRHPGQISSDKTQITIPRHDHVVGMCQLRYISE